MPKSPHPKTPSFEKVLPWLLVTGGVIGLICSFIISLDKVRLLENPNFKPNCDLNPVVSCGSVMASKQGSVFGFPNPWIGLVTFAVLIAVGMAIFAGAKFKRWFWIGLESGVLLGLAFAYWLLFESVYRIRALCPYCLTVDVALITVSWYLSLYLVEQHHIRPPKAATGITAFARKHHLDMLLVWFIVLTVIILKHFWYYYGKHL
jgi:uncharacterized membrane protein